MKTELVNLVTADTTETIVLLTTELDELTSTERVRALELAIWLMDEGWTVMTMADSPLAPVVRKGAEAMHGTYRSYDSRNAARIESSRHQLPPTLDGRSMTPRDDHDSSTGASIQRDPILDSRGDQPRPTTGSRLVQRRSRGHPLVGRCPMGARRPITHGPTGSHRKHSGSLRHGRVPPDPIALATTHNDGSILRTQSAHR